MRSSPVQIESSNLYLKNIFIFKKVKQQKEPLTKDYQIFSSIVIINLGVGVVLLEPV